VLNRFRTGQGFCAANLRKWGFAFADKCECGMVQTMSRVVNECTETMLSDGGLQRLHSADTNAVNWLERNTMKALAK